MKQPLILQLLLAGPTFFASCASVPAWLPGGPERIPKKLEAERVPKAIERARENLAAGRTDRAIRWMRAASAASELSPETREEVQKLLEESAEARIRQLSAPDSDPEELADMVDMDLPRQIAVTAGIQAARRMVEMGEPMDAFGLVQKLDTKYPLHHERVSAGELLADIGLSLSQDYSSFLFFYDRQSDAQQVLEYVILNYPRAARCDEAYSTLSRIYADDREWHHAIDRLEKLVLNHPASPLRPATQAAIPRLRLDSIESPEYDRGALLRARGELDEWLRTYSGHEPAHAIEPRVRADLTDCLRRLSDSDRSIAAFYDRVDNPYGARRHAERAIQEARAAGDEERARAAEALLQRQPPPPEAAAPPSGTER